MLTLTLRQPERHELVPRTVHPCVPHAPAAEAGADSGSTFRSLSRRPASTTTVEAAPSGFVERTRARTARGGAARAVA
ncbi:hypothetical protein [Streptomyces albus]|uniref:hypothetical protein n=1 Tax=Streptomyces albus TaxID=1888 RepID=UPI003D15E270